MRILQIFNCYLERGGEEASAERVSASLSRRHDVFHCYFNSRQMGNSAGVASIARMAKTMAWNPRSAARLRRQIRAVKPGVILLHNFFPVGSASLLHEAQKSGIPVIHYIHNFRPFSVSGYLWARERVAVEGLQKNFFPEVLAGSWQNSRVKTGLYAAILTGMHHAGMFRRISHWIAISEFMRDAFIEAGISREKISTVRHSWDALPECPAAEDHGFYLFLGRLITAKGVRVLFETWRILRERLGAGCPRLVICGEGPLADEVTIEAASSSSIEFLGRVDGEEKSRLLKGCRAVLAPSLWWEALGLVTYEAYDNGKPMLAARSGGLTETVEHGRTGYLHMPGNASELAEQIMKIDADTDLRTELGRNGRAWLLQNTSPDLWREKFDLVLEKITKS